MAEIVACGLAFLVVAAVIIYFGYLLRNSTSSKRDLLRDGLAEYRKARTNGERLVVFFWYSVLLLLGGLFTMLFALVSLLVSAAAAVCGANPWPYVIEIFHRIMDELFDGAGEPVPS